MNKILFGLTSFEKTIWNRPALQFRTYFQLARFSSSIRSETSKKHFAKPFFSTSITESANPYQLPRYFTRGVLDKDKKYSSEPCFYLLTETDEQPVARPLPRKRNLLRTLCRGKGTLRQTTQGYVYLDVDNQFILALLPYLIAQGLSRPPYFNLFHSPEGAHIPVISRRETFFQDIGRLREIGREFVFEIEGLYSVKPHDWPEIDEIWYFKVTCSELEQLRRDYFLPSLPNGHPLVIATAVKPSSLPAARTPTFRINPAAYAA